MEDVFGSLEKYIYSRPGIFQIVCRQNNYALFGESENIFQSLKKIYSQLRSRDSDNKKLLADYRQYGHNDFDFNFLSIDPKFKDPDVRKTEVEKLKKEWDGDLY